MAHCFIATQVAFKWLVFLIGPLDLIGMGWGEDHKANIIEIHFQNKLHYVFKYG